MGSDTTPANSDPVPTQYVSPRSCFPLILVPTLYVFPLYPTSDYAPFVGTLIPFRMSSLILISLCAMFSLFPTPNFYLRSEARGRSRLPLDLGHLMFLSSRDHP